jgi:crossover junction endodeoxyribonuclease RuvC
MPKASFKTSTQLTKTSPAKRTSSPVSSPVVLGFDPGTQATGYGVVTGGKRPKLIDFGAVKTRSGEVLEARLKTIHARALELIDRHKPDIVAVEDPFVGKSARSALVLGQARGVILLAAAIRDLPVASYPPRAIKAAVVGRGGATKEQVQFMVQRLLGMKKPPEPLDASDALAVALCHVSRGPDAFAGRREPADVSKLVKNPEDLDAVRRWKSGKG